MSKHTPGKWRLWRHDWMADEYSVVVDIPERDQAMAIATDMTMANAHLIAAAPDIYEALRDLLAGFRYIRETYGDIYGVAWDRAEEKACAALAKARGEA